MCIHEQALQSSPPMIYFSGLANLGILGFPWGILTSPCQVCKKPWGIWRLSTHFIWGIFSSPLNLLVYDPATSLLGPPTSLSLRIFRLLWLTLPPVFPSAFSLDICLGCGTLQVYAQHPLFEGGICAPCKVSRGDSGTVMTWDWRGRSRTQTAFGLPQLRFRISSWRPSSCTMRMGTRATAPSALPGVPCSSVRAPTVPGEARPNFLLLLPKEPLPPTSNIGGGAEGCASAPGVPSQVQ